ncbi:MAG: four helix bundle protein [Candidatus Paceibacterota bacterium]
MKIDSFRDLVVWQKSMELSKQIYAMTKELPKEEQFGLVFQLRRCAVSIPSNIAEGSKRGTRKDYVRFLRIAQGSGAELETQLLLVRELYKVRGVEEIQALLEEVQKMLTTMVKKLDIHPH